jgi:hypothetical protein
VVPVDYSETEPLPVSMQVIVIVRGAVNIQRSDRA